LRSALNVTAPLPVPDDPAVTVNQSAFELAVQLHPAPVAVTVTVPLPPRSPTCWLVGAMVNEHGASPSCVTVNVCPATLIVPVRAVPRFGSTANPTDPLPVPDAPEVTMIHAALALEAAVHEQVPPVVTVTDPVPPATATF
jgi:hypothetical protein